MGTLLKPISAGTCCDSGKSSLLSSSTISDNGNSGDGGSVQAGFDTITVNVSAPSGMTELQYPYLVGASVVYVDREGVPLIDLAPTTSKILLSATPPPIVGNRSYRHVIDTGMLLLDPTAPTSADTPEHFKIIYKIQL